MTFEEKVLDVRRRLRSLESAVVAFSGGVDSSVLVALAHEELGERMIAVTAISPSLPKADQGVAQALCAERSIPHAFVTTSELSDPAYASNPPNRCYFCKRHLFERLLQEADLRGMRYVVEGTNRSDLGGHRPGHQAARECERVRTPLIDAGLDKREVRALAAQLGLPTSEKPAAACLASRLPVGEKITQSVLERIDAAEELFRAKGCRQVRVRHHDHIARVEVDPDDMHRCLLAREELAQQMQALGWKYVTLDLMGYREGSMHT